MQLRTVVGSQEVASAVPGRDVHAKSHCGALRQNQAKLENKEVKTVVGGGKGDIHCISAKFVLATVV